MAWRLPCAGMSASSASRALEGLWPSAVHLGASTRRELHTLPPTKLASRHLCVCCLERMTSTMVHPLPHVYLFDSTLSNGVDDAPQ
eukprot:2293153-Pleurochrysis_carterae.AAC.3